MSTAAPAWLGIIPSPHTAPAGAAPASHDAAPGDPLVVTRDEAWQLDRLAGKLPHSPNPVSDWRQAVCRMLGPERVGVVLRNAGRGLATPVVVE